MVLFGLLVVAYRTMQDPDTRRFTRGMPALVALLAFSGAVVDMLDIVVKGRALKKVLGIIEDGGEMIVASLIVAYTFCNLSDVRRHSRPG
ncbi:MAG: hypothetical protein GY798_25245 [Hyphomicrobiales bacterium]|nr:hypothetical protein [Hyphomicrobiales bacterium]